MSAFNVAFLAATPATSPPELPEIRSPNVAKVTRISASSYSDEGTRPLHNVASLVCITVGATASAAQLRRHRRGPGHRSRRTPRHQQAPRNTSVLERGEASGATSKVSLKDLGFKLEELSVPARVIATFPEFLPEETSLGSALAELEELSKTFPLSHSLTSADKLAKVIRGLQSQGFKVPAYPDDPQNDGEKDIKSRYDKLLQYAVDRASMRALKRLSIATTERSAEIRALPFVPPPGYWAFVKNVPGDAGFDPLGLGSDGGIQGFEQKLEAETKHGRFAMLAGVGIPASELFHSKIADALQLPNLLDKTDGRFPSLINGGLDEPLIGVFLGCIAAFVLIVEVNKPVLTGVPGYYGFDPLGMADFEPPQFIKGLGVKDVPWVAEAEVKNGRLAMIAVTAMVAYEAITQEPVTAALANALAL